MAKCQVCYNRDAEAWCQVCGRNVCNGCLTTGKCSSCASKTKRTNDSSANSQKQASNSSHKSQNGYTSSRSDDPQPAYTEYQQRATNNANDQQSSPTPHHANMNSPQSSQTASSGVSAFTRVVMAIFILLLVIPGVKYISESLRKSASTLTGTYTDSLGVSSYTFYDNNTCVLSMMGESGETMHYELDGNTIKFSVSNASPSQTDNTKEPEGRVLENAFQSMLGSGQLSRNRDSFVYHNPLLGDDKVYRKR